MRFETISPEAVAWTGSLWTLPYWPGSAICRIYARLRVGLHTGEDYEYFDVPAQTYSGLLAAESKGHYYNRHIRNEFRFHRIKKTTAT